MAVDVKICGITEADYAHLAAEHGARWLGFVFFEKSPRNLTLEAAEALGKELPGGPKRVGVFVNAPDPLLKSAVEALSLDAVQLHGNETPEDAARLKEMLGVKIIKAISIGGEDDLAKADAFLPHVDRILFDAKPPKDAVLPGGNAVALPWHILKGKNLPYRWILAGGLTAENVAEAIAASDATAVDISSGVESAPGKKSPERIKAFLSAAKAVK
ncbi:MAG: phosphoribosylanthranilate isomerase [Kordiimonadaceae bacterium]|nr:phosphoribosylanthranilate isomerase [Kordiimonadaceae bacterium]